MTGTCTDVGEAEFLEELSDIARMKVDAEPLGDDTLEVNAPPARDPEPDPDAEQEREQDPEPDPASARARTRGCEKMIA